MCLKRNPGLTDRGMATRDKKPGLTDRGVATGVTEFCMASDELRKFLSVGCRMMRNE